jgi:hypothetical protein
MEDTMIAWMKKELTIDGRNWTRERRALHLSHGRVEPVDMGAGRWKRLAPLAVLLTLSVGCVAPGDEMTDRVRTLSAPLNQTEAADQQVEDGKQGDESTVTQDDDSISAVGENPHTPRPDLVVNILDTVFPIRAIAVPIGGGFVETSGKHLDEIIVEVRNVGNATALPSRVQVDLGDHYCPDIDPATCSKEPLLWTTLGSAPVPVLAAGASYVATIDGLGEDFDGRSVTILATADIDHVVAESSESNNTDETFENGFISFPPMEPFDYDPADSMIEIRINDDAAGITERLLPAMGDAMGLNFLTLPDSTLVKDKVPTLVADLAACHSRDARFELNMNDITVRSEIRSHSVEAEFLHGKRVNTDLDLPHFDLQFELEFLWKKDVESGYCRIFGSDIRIAVQVNVDGVSGELDVTVENAGKVKVASIDKFEIDVDRVSFDSGFLTALTDLGFAVADLFGHDCDSLTACVNAAIDEDLTERAKYKNMLRDILNDGLDYATRIDGATDLGFAQLDYAVGLKAIFVNDAKDRLKTRWDVDFDSDAPSASCADGLTRLRMAAHSDVQTSDDLDIALPYYKLSDLLYEVTRQGDVCAPFDYEEDGDTTEVAIKPNGAFTVEGVGANQIALRVPVEIEATDTRNAAGAISAELEIIAALQPACGAGFQLATVDVNINNITGTMTYTLPGGGTLEMNASAFAGAHKARAEAQILAALQPAIMIAPGAFGLNALGAVSVGDVVHSTGGVTVGVNVVTIDPYC